eukprot:XP_011666452.1 PREDICTED: nuclear pore complex protein Nup205-like [Strongylocentrotus purpuratus]
MPLKVKEIRNRGDEAGRLIMSYEREGLEVNSNLPRHFEDFLHLFGYLYEKDPLQLELSLDYWNPPERGSSPGGGGGASYLSMYHHKQSQRQVSQAEIWIKNLFTLISCFRYISSCTPTFSFLFTMTILHPTYNLLFHCLLEAKLATIADQVVKKH